MHGMRRNVIPLHEKALLENARAAEANAEAERLAANIDYLSMMCDVEIPTEEGAELEDEFLEEDEEMEDE